MTMLIADRFFVMKGQLKVLVTQSDCHDLGKGMLVRRVGSERSWPVLGIERDRSLRPMEPGLPVGIGVDASSDLDKGDSVEVVR